jgi:hypothetical protein
MASKLDASGWIKGLDRLAGPLKESLARRMALAGGKVLQEEAKHNARISNARTDWVYNPDGKSASSDVAGNLADAIYLARDQKHSSENLFTYRISWNNTDAWWGRLREFGYRRTEAFFKDEKGMYHTLVGVPLKKPFRVPAKPFLAPAYDSHIGLAKDAMLKTGHEELPKLLAGEP